MKPATPVPAKDRASQVLGSYFDAIVVGIRQVDFAINVEYTSRLCYVKRFKVDDDRFL